MSEASSVRPAWGRVPYDIDSRRAWLRMPFPESEYKARWHKVADRLKSLDLSAAVIFGTPGNCGGVRYLTNFESYVGQTAVVIDAGGRCAIATDSLMRAEPMQSGIWMTCVEDVRPTANRRYMPSARPLEEVLTDLLADYAGPVGGLALSGPAPAAIVATLASFRAGARVAEFDAELADVMAVKSSAEIDLLRQANQIADAVMDCVLENLRPGISEAALAGLAFGEMMRHGAEGPAFPLALTAGPRTGLKHASPTDYVLESGDMFFIDFGLIYEGYMTDNARSGVVGQPNSEQLAFLRVCEEMTAAAAAVAKPGTAQKEIDDAAYAVAKRRGYAADYYFRAHGVGTALFLPPRFSPGDNKVLRVGEVFSLEPMLVRHGYGTACVENTVLVTESGAEVLNGNPARWW